MSIAERGLLSLNEHVVYKPGEGIRHNLQPAYWRIGTVRGAEHQLPPIPTCVMSVQLFPVIRIPAVIQESRSSISCTVPLQNFANNLCRFLVGRQ